MTIINSFGIIALTVALYFNRRILLLFSERLKNLEAGWTRPVLDYPHIRQQYVCPICMGYKDHGLVTCWDCYKKWSLRYGTPLAALRLMDAMEDRLARTA